MRIQLALNVQNLDTAIDFYSKMFDTTPAKTKTGYANFAIEHPPLKLVLFETGDSSDGNGFAHLNHLGVEVDDAEEVVAAESRLSSEGVATTGVDDAVCCFAEKTETWVESPDGARWEWYVKTADADEMEHVVVAPHGSTRCCG